MSSAVVEPGHVIAGRYRVEGLLGQGAMGSVHRAVQLSVARRVALKLLVDEHRGSAAYIERFEREAQALSRLSHPNTVRLFDFGTTEQGCPFLVMELLVGSDLASDLERQGPLRWDQMLAVIQGVAASLAEAHAAGIVHRDIKPANVFLCAGGTWPAIKVLDFGVAGATQPGTSRKLTATGAVVGSAAYMSPEQAQGQPAGAASDLYGLGVLAFEALTGKTPFEGRAFTAQLLAKVLEPAPALRDVCPGLELPAGVERLVSELLEREPARRPPSARAVLERATALLDRASLPPLARPVLTLRECALGSGVAKTVPMRVERTIDEGWSPPKTEVERVPHAARPARAVRRLGWAALAGGVGIACAWALSSQAPHVVPLIVASLTPRAHAPEATLPPALAPAATALAPAAPALEASATGSFAPPGPTLAPDLAQGIDAPTESGAAAADAPPTAEPPETPPAPTSEESPPASGGAENGTAAAERPSKPARPSTPRARPRPRPAAAARSATREARTAESPATASAPATGEAAPTVAAEPPAAAPAMGQPAAPVAPTTVAPASGATSPAGVLASPPSATATAPVPPPGSPSLATSTSTPTAPSNASPAPGALTPSALIVPAPPGSGEASPASPPPAAPADRPVASAAPSPEDDRSSPAPRPPDRPVASAAPSPEGDRSSPAPRPLPARPSNAAPSVAERRSRDLLRRFPNVAAVRQALAAGVITPLQRNRLIARLSERRYEARARAARDYQEGRIGRSELRALQRAIERDFEGFSSDP